MSVKFALNWPKSDIKDVQRHKQENMFCTKFRNSYFLDDRTGLGFFEVGYLQLNWRAVHQMASNFGNIAGHFKYSACHYWPGNT